MTHVPKLDDSVLLHSKFSIPTRLDHPDVLLGVGHFAQLKMVFESELPSVFSLYGTTLGPLLCGKGELRSTVTAKATCISLVSVEETCDDDLHHLVKSYFSNESCELANSKSEVQQREDELSLRQFQQTVKYVPTDSQNFVEPPERYTVTLSRRTG